MPLGCLVLVLSACQPGLNWRQLRSSEAGLTISFPCKPDLELRGAAGMGLLQCEAAGARYSVAWADVADPAGVGPALLEMPRALAAKLKQPPPHGQALVVPGMTPHPEAASFRMAGSEGVVHLAVFAHGQRAYQVLRLGPSDDPAAWDSFVNGLRIGGAQQAGG